MYDILIRNASIIDGTGSPAYPGDIGIAGDRIVALGHLGDAEARRVIDAAGRVVCPGFVDIHSHTDRTILRHREARSSLHQGVTTEITGNCGMTYAPVSALSRPALERGFEMFCSGVPLKWEDFGQFLDCLAEGTAVNLGVMVGHNAVRRAVLGREDRVANGEEMAAMEQLVEEALEAGAIGLSFGLEFMPGRASEPEELRRLCAVAGRHRKMTAWHVRNRDRKFVEAVEEAIAVTRAAGVGLQLSHLSAKPGSSPRAWNQVMESVRLARARGQDIQCDMIAYTVGPGLLSTILPNWASQGTIEEVSQRLRDPKVREKLIEQSDRYWFLFYYREWDKLTLSSTAAHPEWRGMTFREIGQAAGKDPFDIVYDILADEGEGMDEVWINGVLFSEGDIIEWLSDPLFSIASDGLAVTDGPECRSFANHPTNYGWTPTVIGKYVHELRALRLETAIRKMTSMPAARFGIYDRGIIRAGALADILVFDPSEFTTRATFANPFVYAEGMDYVLINGQIALEAGVPTGVLAGRVLRD